MSLPTSLGLIGVSLLPRTSRSGRALRRSGETWVRTTWRAWTSGSTCLGGRGGVHAPDAWGHPPTPHRVSSFQGCPRWRRASPTAASHHRRGPWVLPYASALVMSWRSPWPRLSSSGGRWGRDTCGLAGMDLHCRARPPWPCWEGPLLWGQTTMVMLGWTSAMGADHCGHAGIDPHDGL